MEKLTEILYELIELNHDRAKCYEEAAAEANTIDLDLRTIFLNMANDSKIYVTELKEQFSNTGETFMNRMTGRGKLLQGWLDVKAGFLPFDRHSLLDACAYAEVMVQKEYTASLDISHQLPVDINALITRQKAYLKMAHKMIKSYRDADWKMIA